MVYLFAQLAFTVPGTVCFFVKLHQSAVFEPIQALYLLVVVEVISEALLLFHLPYCAATDLPGT